MQRAIDDTYGKASDSKAISKDLMDLVDHRTDDIKRNGRDGMENTEDMLDKISRVQKSIDELHQVRRTDSQCRGGRSEHSRSPSREGERIKQNLNGGIATPTKDDNIIKNKLT